LINNHIAPIPGRIHGVAAYYSANDATQHVVAATDDGNLYEVHWNLNTPYTSPRLIPHAQFPGIASLSGFFTPDDNFQHVVVETGNARLHERYFPDPLQSVQSNDFGPLQIGSGAGPHIGMSGSYSSDDGLRHVVVGSDEGILYEVVWSAQVQPERRSLATQFTLPDVAAIAGFFDPSAHSQDVIVAMQGGDVFDVHYYKGFWAGGSVITDQVPTTSSSLKNVAAFVSPEGGIRHVILLDHHGQVSDYSYSLNSGQAFGTTKLITMSDVVDMAAYYSDYDRTNHVILATNDATGGHIHEVYYE
jgi:hypothetical protein